MFTGIITDVGEVLEVVPRAEGLRRLSVGCRYDPASLAIGASVACAGVCLTVVEVERREGRTVFSADVAAETLKLTTAAHWRAGTRINLERALRLGDELGGHLVSGHVDGTADLVAREDLDGMSRMTLRAPRGLSRFIAPKGSVALDGTSLTINDVTGAAFSVLLIPHTLAVTTLDDLSAGDRLNLEVDTMARYAARLLETR